MKKEQDNIDKLFKRGLEDPVDETGFIEDDWDALEQMLDGNKKRRGILFWLPVLSSVAALLLLFFGWWIFRPQVTDHQQKQRQQIAITHKPGEIITEKSLVRGNTVPAVTTTRQEKTPIAANINSTTAGIIHLKHKAQFGLPVNKAPDSNSSAAGQNNNDQITAASNTRGQTILAATSAKIDIATPATGSEMPAIAAVNILPETWINSHTGDLSKSEKDDSKKAGLAYRPQYAISVIASPELNGVNSLQQGRAGSNFGVLFSAGFFKKFTISTGVSYSTKPYATGFANYHTTYKFKTDPQSISADCRVLDIPLNVDYQLYSKYRNKISIGTGLSSYLMMHESYEYNYANTTTAGPEYFNVKNPGNYLFSILNLQATYQRQINSKVGISLQPYLKLPLSTIGVSQARLQTAGIAIGLNWNINSRTKP